jgi:protoporphyrinogen oxidase
VVERNSYVGGLAATFNYKGYRFDLGGHRWFTKNEELNDWFRRLMEGELLLVDRVSRIYHQGRYFSYPVRLPEILTQCDPLTIAGIFCSFLWSSLKQAALNPSITTMEEAYTAQFGAALYRMFFQQYSEKVWGVPCTNISADWVAQRSRGLSIWDLARETLLGPRKDVVSLVDQFMYPRNGYGRISERMAEDIRGAGNEVLLDCPVTRLSYRGPNDIEVVCVHREEEQKLWADNVVSTIPLGLLVQMVDPVCEPEVVEVARSLLFRDIITVNLILRKPRVSEDTWLYIQDSEIIFGRMHEPKNWSRAMVRDQDHTSLVLECFCSEGDRIWTMPDEDIVRCCIDDLCDKLRFIDKDEVEDAKVIRARFAYPVYDLKYRDKLTLIQNSLQRYAGLHTVGRTGTFRYNNADHSIEMGLLLARKLLGEATDPMVVNIEAEYHEEKRVGAPKLVKAPASERF